MRSTGSTGASSLARTVPLLYLGTAHAALALACALVLAWPRAAAGFFYHSWMVALVHLVTLGWITFSILGAIYLVGPLALRMDMRTGRMDVAAYLFATLGLAGMVGHVWIEEYSGMVWAAAILTGGGLFVTARILAGLLRARVHGAVKLHIVLACVNFWLAAVMGMLIGVNKTAPLLPGFVLSHVFAHAHLAAIGWATMMVVGVGYRLLPMILPARMPSGASMYASAILLEAGTLGLFTALVLGRPWGVVFGLLIVAGLAVFAGHVVWMLRHPALRPAAAPRFDFAIVHAALAGGSLLAALSLGVGLLVAPASAASLRAAAAYGAMGLLGFLAQMVVAMETRVLPIAAWCWAYARSGYRSPPPSPHRMRDRGLQALVLAGWAGGVPALAGGLALESAPLVGAGAAALLASVAIAAIDHAYVLAARTSLPAAAK